ncbi:phosphatidylserine decarboxylase-domain-containing protein [Thamnidium elegans]|nr:phosphatidylserine decarboxylase-domain-containing protein [Thamnidium elegans]
MTIEAAVLTADTERISQDFGPNKQEVEEYIKNNDHAALMRSFSQMIDQSTHSEAVLEESGIQSPSSQAPKHWYRRKLSGWIHKHLVPEGFRTAVEKKYGNFIIIRSTGEYHYEEMPIYTRIGMHLLFGGYYRGKVVSSSMMHALFLKETLRQGLYFTLPESVKQIPSFVQHYMIEMDNYVISKVSEYQNFNEFFTRAILPGKRPIAELDDDSILVSAADSRLNVFTSIDTATEFWIKGKNFNLTNLLKDEALAEELDGGSIAIFRLAPQDYHRFHTPAKGTVESINTLSGTYYTVNPCTVNESLDVFTDNHRSITKIKSHQGFNYAVISIGALLVGSIVMTNAEPEKELEKGQEMGYFQYGGSTVIVVFPKDTVEWDQDLKLNSEKSLETLVEMGERIGSYCV